MNCSGRPTARGGGELRPPEPQRDPLEFLSRSWSASAADVSRALAASAPAAIAEDVAGELDDCSSGAGTASGSSFSFASAATSQLILDRIMSQSQEVSPLTSGRLSHSSGSLSDSPPVSPDVDDGRNSEHAEAAAAAAAAARREQDGGAVVQGPEGEAEGGGKGAQRAGARRRLGGGRGRGGRGRCRRHRGVRQGRPRRAHRHGGGVCRDAGGRSVRGGRGVLGRRARAPRRRRRLRRQRQDPRRHRHHHGRRRHRVARRGDAEGEGDEGSAERGGGDPRGQGLHGNGRPPQARRSEAAAAASQGGAGSGQQQQQQLQRRPAGAGPGREQQLPRHLLPGAARPRHRAPQAHPQRIIALEGCLSVHQPDRRGDAEDEKPACRRDHNQEEEERGGGRVQGRGGMAWAAPAGRRRAPALLRPAHGGAPGYRVRVREPEGSRHVDQGSGTPPRHRQWPQALCLRPPPSWTAAAVVQLVVSNGC